MPREEAGAAIERTLLESLGADGAEGIARAQVRIAWEEVTAEVGLSRAGNASMTSSDLFKAGT